MQPSTFANNLRVQRVKANLNQAQLAQAIGYAQNQISKWKVDAAAGFALRALINPSTRVRPGLRHPNTRFTDTRLRPVCLAA